MVVGPKASQALEATQVDSEIAIGYSNISCINQCHSLNSLSELVGQTLHLINNVDVDHSVLTLFIYTGGDVDRIGH